MKKALSLRFSLSYLEMNPIIPREEGGGERIAEEIRRNVGMIREGKILELCLFFFLGKNSLREEKIQLLLSALSPPHGDKQCRQ